MTADEPRQATPAFPADYPREQMLRDVETARDALVQNPFSVPPILVQRHEFTPDQVAQLARIRASAETLGTAFTNLGRAVAEAVDPLQCFLREAGLIPEEPPTDARQRALWMRQHRGHGPHTTPVNQRRRTR